MQSSYKIGSIRIKYSELVKMFGFPNHIESGDCKVQWEWELDIDGYRVYIYDWKEYDVIDPEDIDEWNIGGRNSTAYYALIDEINRLKEGNCQFD